MILALVLAFAADGSAPSACDVGYTTMVERVNGSWASQAGKASVIARAAIVRDECRRHELEEKQAEAKAQQSRQIEVDARARLDAAVEQAQTSPAYIQMVNSARLCALLANRQSSLAVIAKERKYAKLGGVVHLDRIGEAQDEIAEADESIAEWRAGMKAAKERPLSCKAPEVARLTECLDAKRGGGDTSDPCQADRIQIALRVIDED